MLSLTKPNTGDLIRVPLVNKIIDEIGVLETQQGNGGMQIPNGSFEYDTDSDGIPNCWYLTLYAGGSAGLSTTVTSDGGKSWYGTCDGITGNGGALLESDLFPITEGVHYLDFFMQCSSATMSNLLEIYYYTKANSYLSASVVWSASTGWPTTWARERKYFTVPAGGKYAQIRLTSGVTGSSAGTCYWDDFSIKKVVTEDSCYFFGSTAGIATSGLTLKFSLLNSPANANSQFTIGTSATDYAITIVNHGIYYIDCIMRSNTATYSAIAPVSSTLTSRFQTTIGSPGEGTTVLTGTTCPQKSLIMGLVNVTAGTKYKVRYTSDISSSITVAGYMRIARVK